MTHWENAAERLREARLELLEAGRGEVGHDQAIGAYNALMAFCQRHELVAAESPAPRLRSVA